MKYIDDIEQVLAEKNVAPGALEACGYCKGAGWVEYVTPHTETRREMRKCPLCGGARYQGEVV